MLTCKTVDATPVETHLNQKLGLLPDELRLLVEFPLALEVLRSPPASHFYPL